MRCPYCGDREDRVLDSRETSDGVTVRRRRECKQCGRRFNTFEQIEEMALFVVKRDGRREPFSREKILKGLRIACTGRAVTAEQMASAADDIERMLYNRLEHEVTSQDVGDLVMERLRRLDQVAYVRFASVYRQFEDATQFREIVNMLRRKARSDH